MYFKKFLTEVKQLKAQDTSKIVSDKTRGALVGAGIGGTIGIVIGLVKKKNILFSAMVGAVLGAGISRTIKIKNNKNKNNE